MEEKQLVEGKKVKKSTKVFSKFLTVVIIFLVLICLVLFFKIVTKSEVSILGIKFYYVMTESMYPTIKPHSLVVVKSVDPNTLEVGDIISFVSRDQSIYGMINTHRIFDIVEENGQRYFITMGDNNPSPDSLPVYPNEITGKVIAHTPPIKGFTQFLEFAGTSTGFIVVIILPLILILAMVFRNFFKNFRASLAEAEEEELRLIQESNAPESENDEAKKAAIIVLETYFGKKINEITEDDIEKKLNNLK